MENVLKNKNQLNVKELDQPLKNILDSVPALIAYVNSELRYEFMNKAYEQWYGIDRSSALGKTMAEVLDEKTFEKLSCYISKALKGSPVNFITEINSRNEERTIDATYTPNIDEFGNVIGLTVLVNDITEKVRIEKELERARRHEALRKNDERYLKMIEGITDYAIIFLNKDGIIENWNKGAEKIKGYTKEEIIGRHFTIFYVPEDVEQRVPYDLMQEAVENGKAMREGWRLRKDGSVFWGHITLTALYDEHNKLTGFSKVTRDLTERKLAEEKLQQYARQLESQNKDLEHFAYVASHDLQEPLRKIKTFNERILQLEKLSDQGREYFNRAISAANRMQRLITDLLAYSRATHDPDNLEEVDLNIMLKEIIASRKELVDDNQVTFEIGNILPTISAIPFQMFQLFDNVISNSLKYRKPDRKLKVKISSQLVSGESLNEKGADSYKDYWHIMIADNGIGFEPLYNERIFEIFQRLHGQATPGSGLGLAICKKIVTNHQGFIMASGLPDEGATFDIYLPA